MAKVEFTKLVYDSLGHATKTYYATNPSESGYAAASNLTNNTIFTQSETTYDAVGNAILQTQIERLSTASTTGALTLLTGRYQSTATWYDSVGRQIATANYGTNGGVALTRPATVMERKGINDNEIISNYFGFGGDAAPIFTLKADVSTRKVTSISYFARSPIFYHFSSADFSSTDYNYTYIDTNADGVWDYIHDVKNKKHIHNH